MLGYEQGVLEKQGQSQTLHPALGRDPQAGEVGRESCKVQVTSLFTALLPAGRQVPGHACLRIDASGQVPPTTNA